MSIASALKKKVATITNDGVKAVSAEGIYTTGSPFITSLADAYKVELAPAAQTDGGRAGDSVTFKVAVTNRGYVEDTYTLAASGGTFPATVLDADCSTAATTTSSLNPGETRDLCVRVDVNSGATGGATSTSTVTATSVGSPGTSASGTVTTIAITADTLVVDGDGNAPDVAAYYTAALTMAGVTNYAVWDLATDPVLPPNYLKAFTSVVWFTGNAYPGPITPYEAQLASYLDAGGNLFMSGQDILDQGAGTTDFVADYLHIAWDGSDDQNDIATDSVTAVAGTLTDGLDTVDLDHDVLQAAFEDQITPIPPAVAIFRDENDGDNGLSVTATSGVTGTTYKVVFLAFPFEAYGNADNQADLMGRIFGYFGP